MLRTFNIKQGDQFSFTVTFTNLQEDLTTFTMGVKKNYQDAMLITKGLGDGIEKIDTDNKTIKLPATTGFNDTYKRVYGYVENSCNNTYWKTNNSSNVFNGNLRIQTLIESFFVTISGTMERSGTAVANQTVVFLNSLNHAECVCTSDADGAYSARLSKGTYSIIRLPNRASVTSVTLTGDTTMTLEIPS